jgi:hypothetical protein
MPVQQSEQQVVAVRLERLERQNRTLKLAGSVLLLACAMALCMGASAPRRTIETDILLIKDASGRTRMILGMADDGPAITMLDANGKLRANIGVSGQGPELDFLDTAETPRLQLLLDEHQEPHLNLLNKKGAQLSFRP